MRDRKNQQMMPVGMGPGSMPYDRSGLSGDLSAMAASPVPGGQVELPYAQEPMGLPRVNTGALSNQDLMGMQDTGMNPLDQVPMDQLMGQQMSDQYMDPNLDPQARAQIEAMLMEAARRGLLGG